MNHDKITYSTIITERGLEIVTERSPWGVGARIAGTDLGEWWFLTSSYGVVWERDGSETVVEKYDEWVERVARRAEEI